MFTDTYGAPEVSLTGTPMTTHVTVMKSFRLRGVFFLCDVPPAPWWVNFLTRVRRPLGWPLRGWRSVLGWPMVTLETWWFQREQRRLLGKVRVRGLQIAGEDQLVPNADLPALLFESLPELGCPWAKPGDVIRIELDGTAPLPVAVLFRGERDPSEDDEILGGIPECSA